MKKLILAACLPALLAGCYVAGRGTVAYEASPPPPRYVVVEARPGYTWVDGHWYWNSSQWLWNDGYYVVDRPGYVWVQGNYYGRRYRPGYWSTPRPGYTNYGNGGRSSAAGNVVRGGMAPSSAPSRAGQYMQPSRSSSPPPGRHDNGNRNGNGNGGNRGRSREH